MGIGRVAGLVMPFLTRPFVDHVLNGGRIDMLPRIVAAVLAATFVQALTSFSLAQIISKSAQRMVADLRCRVQTQIGRLPITYFDANKTGQLVSRIMNDVEGVRSLIGTGMIDFFGSILTAVLAFGYLLHVSILLTTIALCVLVALAVGMNKAFASIRPLFRARPKITAEVTGRLTESLGGIRVIKGYSAEEREENVFAAGVQRLLDNVLKSIGAISLMSSSSSLLLGTVSALIMYFGGRMVFQQKMTTGMWVQYSAFLAILVAPTHLLNSSSDSPACLAKALSGVSASSLKAQSACFWNRSP